MADRSSGLSGPLAGHVPGFRAWLAGLGYSGSAATKQVLMVAALSDQMGREGLAAGDLTAAGAEEFFRLRREEGRANLRTPRSLAPLLEYLREAGAPGSPPLVAAGPVEAFTGRYHRYLISERGLAEGTARFYVHVARLFAGEVRAGGEIGWAGVRAGDVTSFAARACEGRSLSSARQVVSALRCLLRFLRMEGATSLALDQAVLPVAGSAASLPRGISAARVAALLDGCDRRGAIGCRDYAIILLLCRLGLRGGEVIGLTLDDIDWRAGEIVVRGKGGRRDRLPLPSDVGAALADYLRRARPRSGDRSVFLRHYAPVRGLAGTGALRSVLARACARAGIPYASPHRLRHTAATQMLRGGVSLRDIGQVLGHRGTAVTAAYAKVDTDGLRALARRWPEVAA